MMCGVSAARAIASPRLASRASPVMSANQMPAWVAWSAGSGKGTAIPATLALREQKSNEFGRRNASSCRKDLQGLALRGSAQAAEAVAGGEARRPADDLRNRLRPVGSAAHRHLQRGRANDLRPTRVRGTD